jgi:hypothetical protein
MPVEAGIQAVEDHYNFKDLDSRFRGNDNVFSICDTVSVQKRILSNHDP